MRDHCFTSERLGFRSWEDADIEFLNYLNSNIEVMRYFPKMPSSQDNKVFIKRMQELYSEKGYCYFLVEELESGNPIGFIGLADQNYESDFTPAVDIGWRIFPGFWGNGYATEGALRCLEYARDLNLTEVISVAPKINEPSIAVMRKIGLRKVYEFNHPLLKDTPRLLTCVLYKTNSL